MLLEGLSSSNALDGDTKSGSAQAKLNEDLNRFLTLLVTQLQNQDPLDPLDANEFTSQLVQFASVEQQIYANANLEKLLNLQQTSQIGAMVNFIGTTVEAVGNQVPLENGEAQFTYSLDAMAAEVNIAIRNSDDITVFSVEGENEAGKHSFQWDGKNASGMQMPDGAYTVIISALDRDGELLDVAQTTFGRVTGAGAEEGDVSLFMGNVVIPMDDVVSIKESVPAKAPAP